MHLKILPAKLRPFCPGGDELTHVRLVPYIYVSELGQHWLRYWLVACLAPSHYLNQCWNIVNWTLRNKLQWSPNQNSKIFIQENAFVNVVWKMAAILSRPQYVSRFMSLNSLGPSDAIWHWRSWSTLVQVMACCLTAPSHYLNQCWLIITKVQWCSSEGNFARDITAISH